MTSLKELLEKVETFQNMLVSFSTGGQIDHSEYKQLRAELLNEPLIQGLLPHFVRTCRDTYQFWQFIKKEFAHYQERRSFLWSQFAPIIDMLESRTMTNAPSDITTARGLELLNSDTVHEAWRTALDRRFDDPDGAITAARALIETVCKHILDNVGIPYDRDCTLPQLYRLVSDNLGLSANRQTDQVMKRICGSVTATVEGLGSLRNILGDAHGKGANSEKPEARHAELAVNLAGTLATFLIATWESGKDQD